MRFPTSTSTYLYLSLALFLTIIITSAAVPVVKEGSTSIVTSTQAQAAATVKSIIVVDPTPPPSKRDIDDIGPSSSSQQQRRHRKQRQPARLRRNAVFENVELNDSSNAASIKTYPGRGYVRSATFRNIHFGNVNQPVYVTFCIFAGLHCSTAAPCDNLKFSGIDIKPLKGGGIKTLCSNIKNPVSSGSTCTGPCPGSHRGMHDTEFEGCFGG
ncbi:pectin lyase fold/virulence factor [Sordaria sp. MPI-SDFR-AT-0083]|nr:pectin lyase fold/virulence factor [Sordaria sp. MPI-SDFR-AT-0083]